MCQTALNEAMLGHKCSCSRIDDRLYYIYVLRIRKQGIANGIAVCVGIWCMCIHIYILDSYTQHHNLAIISIQHGIPCSFCSSAHFFSSTLPLLLPSLQQSKTPSCLMQSMPRPTSCTTRHNALYITDARAVNWCRNSSTKQIPLPRSLPYSNSTGTAQYIIL